MKQKKGKLHNKKKDGLVPPVHLLKDGKVPLTVLGLLFSKRQKKAVENLLKHIKTGCLSGIPPGGGTTKNERIHQHIKKLFSSQ